MKKSPEDLVHEAWATLQHDRERIDGASSSENWVDLDAPRMRDSSEPTGARGRQVLIRGQPALAALESQIRFATRAGTDSAQLLAGFRGSGKTTILLQLRQALSREFPVIAVDALGYHDGTGPVTIETLLVTLAVAVGEQGAALQVKGAETLGAWTSFLGRIRAALEKVDAELSGEVDLKWLKVNLRGGATFHDRLAGALARQRGDVFHAFEAFFAELIASFGTARPVLLIDGLEKLHQLVDKTAAAYRRFADFFVQYGEVLSIAGAHVVYVVPPQTFVVAPQLRSMFHLVQLSCVRVSPPPPRAVDAVDGIGCDALVEVLARRIDVAALFDPDAQRAIAFASGGHLRNLLAIAADVLMKGSKNAAGEFELPIPLHRSEDAIENHGMFTRQAARANAGILRAINADGDVTRLDSGQIDDLLVAQDLELVLTYCNGDFWYDVNPLVRATLER
ncbi:MAG: hypothetical protein H6747_06530 [Deltaproteobacteria bacterium]|nr:hypothetical protein [Deltaproteobacteria bacterium]